MLVLLLIHSAMRMACGGRGRDWCYWREPSSPSVGPLLQLLLLVLVLFLTEKLSGLGVAAVTTVLDPDGLPLLLSPAGSEDDYHHARGGSEDARAHGRGSGGGLQRVDLVPIVRFC